MAHIKKVHEEAFKAKVALESVRGDLTDCPLRVRPAKNLLGASVSLVVFRNHEEIRRCGASGV
jgi:hypothetical protein